MVDVVLIQPPCDDTHRAYDPQTTLPLGLGYLATAIIEGGFSVKVFDLNTQPVNTVDLLENISRENPHIVGLSVTTPSLRSSYGIVNCIRRSIKADIVLGGPHITAEPTTLTHFGVRYGFQGDVFLGFARLCEHLILGERSLSKIPSLIVNDGSGIQINKREQFDLDGLPHPARHVFPVGGYRNMPVICSWGCPYGCCFCSLSNTRCMNRAPEDVVSEIIEIRREYPPTHIGFVDNVFTLKREITEDICSLLKKHSTRARWSCTTRVDLVDEKLLRKMHSAGCEHISFGVESGVEDIRAQCGKNIPNTVYDKVFKMCHRLGIKTRAYAIFGHQDETVEDMRKTISFMKKINPDYAVFSAMTLYPKTSLTDYLLYAGELRPDVWTEYMRGVCSLPEYTPAGLTSKDIHDLIWDAVKSFYFRPRYLLYRGKNIRSWCDAQEVFGLLGSTLSDGLGFT